MDENRELKLRKFLSDAKLDPKTIETLVIDEDSSPVFQMAVFMKHVWEPVIRKNADGWMQSTVDFLERNKGRRDLYALRFLPERPELLGALKRTLSSNVSEADVTTIVREAQLAVLDHIISMIDGGMSLVEDEDLWSMFELKSASNELMANRMTEAEADKYTELYTDMDDLVPTRPFFDMREYVWLFDPDKNDDEE